MERVTERLIQFDLARMTVRELNQYLHQELPAVSQGGRTPHLAILNPTGNTTLPSG